MIATPAFTEPMDPPRVRPPSAPRVRPASAHRVRPPSASRVLPATSHSTLPPGARPSDASTGNIASMSRYGRLQSAQGRVPWKPQRQNPKGGSFCINDDDENLTARLGTGERIRRDKILAVLVAEQEWRKQQLREDVMHKKEMWRLARCRTPVRRVWKPGQYHHVASFPMRSLKGFQASGLFEYLSPLNVPSEPPTSRPTSHVQSPRKTGSGRVNDKLKLEMQLASLVA
eukprot:GEMP01066531.1.p1 GENE.GEMP01066531.1~~GEMP01066531.1.p1  ORF type:complete len:229 (+),score=47.70 GEMP01066531.1:171-857(+)